MKNKLIIAVIALICTVTIGAGTALAYFISKSGPVINTFTAGDVTITLTETSTGRTPLIPGTTVKKDPVVTVKANSENCYVYVQIAHDGDHESYVSYEIEDGWTVLGGFPGVYYREAASASIDRRFAVIKGNQVAVSSDLTKEKMSGITAEHGGLVITAYAIQTLGMESASDGWYKLLAEIGGEEQ